MDADDLVITLKKSLARLSRTERRKAVELVGDVVREGGLPFDVRLGSSGRADGEGRDRDGRG